MPVGNSVDVLPTWQDEHIEHLEDEVEKLREIIKQLRQAQDIAPKHKDYDTLLANYNKLINDSLPF